jgi:tetratricopeptide (TPR) repeat protein
MIPAASADPVPTRAAADKSAGETCIFPASVTDCVRAMVVDSRFWLLFVVFQVFFGLAVFAITREYYSREPESVPAHPWSTQQSAATWSQGFTESDIARLTSPAGDAAALTDPIEIYRQANDHFVNKQYPAAAQLYERLIEFSPNDAEIYNNLGLTLHYLGRSDEALRWLNEGVAVDAQHQRIWLTLGFVNAQLGFNEEARVALTKAVEVGDNESIRESATKMLEALP